MKRNICTDPWMGGGAPEAALGPDMEGLCARAAEPLLLAGQVQRQATLLLHIYIRREEKCLKNQSINHRLKLVLLRKKQKKIVFKDADLSLLKQYTFTFPQ
jgi:hypothetical protein